MQFCSWLCIGFCCPSPVFELRLRKTSSTWVWTFAAYFCKVTESKHSLKQLSQANVTQSSDVAALPRCLLYLRATSVVAVIRFFRDVMILSWFAWEVPCYKSILKITMPPLFKRSHPYSIHFLCWWIYSRTDMSWVISLLPFVATDFKSGSLDHPDLHELDWISVGTFSTTESRKHATYIGRVTWEISRNHVLIVPAQITSMCDSLPFEYGWNHKSTFGWNEIPTLARQDETVAGIPEDEIRTPLKEGSVQLSWAHFCPNCAETCWICVRVLMEEIVEHWQDNSWPNSTFPDDARASV